MSEALLTQRTLSRVIGASRLRRLLREAWLRPVESNAHSILFSPRDIHAALTRLERERCPPDKVEILRVRESERRNDRGYVPKEKKPRRPAWDLELDLSALKR